MTTPKGRNTIGELTIEPGTGKALELLRGQVLRIEQTSGRQCADFNCFNLHDYKEFFHTGRTRHLHGLHPTKGDFLWSAPPRERPMMAIAAKVIRYDNQIGSAICVMVVKPRKANATRPMPSDTVRLAPSRALILGVCGDSSIMIGAMGRNRIAADSGLNPRTSWKYWVIRNMTPYIERNTSTMPPVAVLKASRRESMPGSIFR